MKIGVVALIKRTHALPWLMAAVFIIIDGGSDE